MLNCCCLTANVQNLGPDKLQPRHRRPPALRPGPATRPAASARACTAESRTRQLEDVPLLLPGRALGHDAPPGWHPEARERSCGMPEPRLRHAWAHHAARCECWCVRTVRCCSSSDHTFEGSDEHYVHSICNSILRQHTWHFFTSWCATSWASTAQQCDRDPCPGAPELAAGPRLRTEYVLALCGGSQLTLVLAR